MKIKWQQAPVKTQWGDEMMVASAAIDKDHTLSLYCERDQTPKVDAMFAQPPKREWVGLTDEELLACTVHNRFEYDPPYINNVGETRVARHEVALRATYENINSKLKELNK